MEGPFIRLVTEARFPCVKQLVAEILLLSQKLKLFRDFTGYKLCSRCLDGLIKLDHFSF